MWRMRRFAEEDLALSPAFPRIRSSDEETFSDEEDDESSDDLSRGLGWWLKVVKFKKRRFATLGKTGHSARLWRRV